MTFGAARISLGMGGWQVDRQPAPDLAVLLTGRPVQEVANLLPRLFNLCRKAQTTAARLALGLKHPSDNGAEVVQDHLARVYVTLRGAFGLPALRPDPAGLAGQMPHTLAELADWMASPQPPAELARAVARSFPRGMGVVPALPPPSGASPAACENSPAGRQAGHPLLQAVEADQGRGPLWRYLGLLTDLEAAHTLPAPHRLPDGTAVVQAARGAYALRLGQAAGVVTHVLRITPTDHQLAPGGPLALALATLPRTRPDLVAQLVALHDPCVPVLMAEVQHA